MNIVFFTQAHQNISKRILLMDMVMPVKMCNNYFFYGNHLIDLCVPFVINRLQELWRKALEVTNSLGKTIH